MKCGNGVRRKPTERDPTTTLQQATVFKPFVYRLKRLGTTNPVSFAPFSKLQRIMASLLPRARGMQEDDTASVGSAETPRSPSPSAFCSCILSDDYDLFSVTPVLLAVKVAGFCYLCNVSWVCSPVGNQDECSGELFRDP